MDLELSSLFPKGEMKRKVVKTITYLMSMKEGIIQKNVHVTFGSLLMVR
ncbi:MAG: hypothetical protein H3Z53_06135 [archaeon]|nr:hypothetical protein [archaeon]